MGGGEDESYIPFNALLRKHTQTHTLHTHIAHVHTHTCTRHMPLQYFACLPIYTTGRPNPVHKRYFSLLFTFHFPFYLSLF